MDSQIPTEPDNSSQQVPPQTSTTHRLRTLIIVLLATFLLLTVGIGAYSLGKRSVNPVQTTTNSVAETTPTPIQTQDPTANWQTFKNQYFTIKLPDDWVDDSSLQETITYLNYDIKTAPQREFNPQTDKGLLKIEAVDFPAQNFRNIEDHYSSNSTLVKPNIQPMKTGIDNQEALKVDDFYYVKHPTKPVVLLISFTLDFPNFSSLQNQIVSKIKFTD